MKKYTIWTMIIILEMITIIFISSTSYSADTLTRVAFSTSEFLLELDACIDKEMKDCTYETNSISVDYEDQINVYLYEKPSFLNVKQKLVITGEHKFLEQKLEALLYISLDIEKEENSVDFHKMLTSVKETGKAVYSSDNYTYDIDFTEEKLTITLRD